MTETYTLTPTQIKKIISFYEDHEINSNNEYISFSAKYEGISISAYTSGKVVFQGKDINEEIMMWNKIFNIKKIVSKEKNVYKTSAIGSDEVGTGDFFGPIVVSSAFVNKSDIEFLEDLGVRDSKKITDQFILETVPKIIKKIKTHTIILDNISYNRHYSKDLNMNKIKAILHNKCLVALKKEVSNFDNIIVDQFTTPKSYYKYLEDVQNVERDITFLTKAEDKHLSVAVASMASRYVFLKDMDRISNELGFVLLKGASTHVDEQAIEIVQKFGIEKLTEISKINFKNMDRIKESI